jgi:hypothetical protein
LNTQKFRVMARIAGVKLKKTASGRITEITFSVKKYGSKLQPILDELGIVVDNDQNAEFEKRWASAITVEEARQISLAHLKTIHWKK